MKRFSFSRKTTTYLTRAAVIAALYVALTFAFAFMSFGPVQFRISEALTILPLIFPEAVPGLFIGCLLSNIMSTPFDIALGSAASLFAALATFLIGYFIRKTPLRLSLGVIPPIIVNALLVPVIILVSVPEISMGYWLDFAFVLLGQSVVILALGIPLYFLMKRLSDKVPSVFGYNLLTRKNPGTVYTSAAADTKVISGNENNTISAEAENDKTEPQ